MGFQVNKANDLETPGFLLLAHGLQLDIQYVRNPIAQLQ
jgi:hypothetical protein